MCFCLHEHHAPLSLHVHSLVWHVQKLLTPLVKLQYQQKLSLVLQDVVSLVMSVLLLLLLLLLLTVFTAWSPMVPWRP
jgi:hypothetical protein